MNSFRAQREITKLENRIEEYKTKHLWHLVFVILGFILGPIFFGIVIGAMIGPLFLAVWVLCTLSNGNERVKAKKRLEKLELDLMNNGGF